MRAEVCVFSMKPGRQPDFLSLDHREYDGSDFSGTHLTGPPHFLDASPAAMDPLLLCRASCAPSRLIASCFIRQTGAILSSLSGR